MINNELIRTQLLERRARLQRALEMSAGEPALADLLHQVDTALEKIAKGRFGLCETCHDSIEPERLLVDPLVRNCLDHLTSAEQRALEHDLDLALRVQKKLLPKRELTVNGWEVAYHYEPAGPVSGDYCDLISDSPEGESFTFFVGDVSGKGVAASILMSRLHAIFRSLHGTSDSISLLVAHANRLFCEGTLSSHFATLAGGRAEASGSIEVFNAAHCLPLVFQRGEVRRIPSTGLALGMFCGSDYSSQTTTLEPGDLLVLYSDGLTEARDPSDVQYGDERLIELVRTNSSVSARQLVQACVSDLERFRAGAPKLDDVTVMVLRKT